jgi:hypothetical protein
MYSGVYPYNPRIQNPHINVSFTVTNANYWQYMDIVNPIKHMYIASCPTITGINKHIYIPHSVMYLRIGNILDCSRIMFTQYITRLKVDAYRYRILYNNGLLTPNLKWLTITNSNSGGGYHTPYVIPQNIERLHFERSDHGIGYCVDKPTNLKYLKICGYINYPSYQSCEIPEGVTHLTLLKNFGFWVDYPQSLTHLTIDEKHVYPISETVTHLTYVGNFNKPLIPNFNVTHLVFGDAFNNDISMIDEMTNLKYLAFGASFDQSIRHLPEGLEYLQLPAGFKKLNGNLLRSIKTLKIGDREITGTALVAQKR